ncbi:MAG TPA: hypothetical protein VM848_07695 [Acidimicrobiia bacterium]|nr:hypothetical protein [Acidimicrobiia bacterium]
MANGLDEDGATVTSDAVPENVDTPGSAAPPATRLPFTGINASTLISIALGLFAAGITQSHRLAIEERRFITVAYTAYGTSTSTLT